jgi:hypothetical protein
MSESAQEGDFIEIDKMSVDQLAGAFVLIMGAIGSLLLVIWQSKCRCSCRIGLSDTCYIFDCTREPPTTDELKTLADETKALNRKQKKIDKKEILSKEQGTSQGTSAAEEILVAPKKPLSRQNSFSIEPEPEPEPEQLDKIV